MKTLLIVLALSFAAVAQNGPTQPSVALSWTQSNSSGVTGNCVYRGVLAGTYTLPALFCSTTPITSYTDTTIVRGTTYHFAVTAKIGASESGYSNDILVVSPAINAPSGLNATQIAKNQVNLTWQLAQIQNVTRQNLYRQNRCTGTFIKQKQLVPAVTSYTDSNARIGCEAYAISAQTKAGEGPLSNVAKVTLQ